MHVRPRNLLDQSARKQFEQADVDRAREHRLEFVAAEPADLAMIAHHRFQPIGDLPQQRIADRVAERIVDVLEAVEIDQEQGAALLTAERRCASASSSVWRIIARLGRPVSESKRGQARDFLLGAALLGEVGADPAEAEEAAALVEHRIARSATSGCPASLAGRTIDVGEGKARREMEAERLAFLGRVRDVAVDRKQVGELPSEQRLRLAVEIVGQLLRDIGQSALGIGFPEPAAAAVFELVDEVQRFARLARRA